MRYLLLMAVLLGSVPASAADFSVATVRPNLSGTGGNRIGTSGATLTMENVTLNICLKLAYGFQDSQISGPDFIQSTRFDIVAKADAPITDQAQMKQMLQSLLTERFHLQLHREQRDVSVYALVPGKNGPKVQKSVGEGRTSMMGKGTLVAQFAPMKALADFLSGPMGKPVMDMTALEGKYDFKLDLTPYMQPDAQTGKAPDVAGMILSGLEQQLGLKLESRRVPMEILVIDHAEKPVEN